MGRDTTLLLQAVDAVHRAVSLEDALGALVGVLQPRFELWYGSLATIPGGSDQIRMLACWSLAETVFQAGTDISATISPTAEAAIEGLREGHAVLTGTSDPNSLLSHLLTQQGVAELVTVPVHSDDASLLMLGLGSSKPGVLGTAVTGFYEGLAAGIREKILKLANSPTNEVTEA